ncbi:MAG: hypothetical protein K2N38_05500 [Oscillospiraceae bacterium]|nr:hypothetical protein [Oscillospiraceae bacterium]
MNENVFREILGESLRHEFAEFDNAPEHKFSLRHRIAMKKVFARYEKNTYGFPKTEYIETMPHYGLKQRIIIALVIIILMTLLTGWFIPIRGITEAQIDWLRSKYDFPNMKMYAVEAADYDSDTPFSLLGVIRKTDEYRGFLSDLVKLEIYSEEEMNALQYQESPLDTRPDSFKGGYILEELPIVTGEESPLDYMRDYVSRIEERISFYVERSKDPNRAIEGDVEFAEVVREKCWEVNHSFLELLEKLFADETGDPDNEKNSLSKFDKDDKRYLLKTYKL